MRLFFLRSRKSKALRKLKRTKVGSKGRIALGRAKMTNLKRAATTLQSFFTRKTRKREETSNETKNTKHVHNNELRTTPSGFRFQLLRVFSILMIMSLLVTSNPAAPNVIAVSAGELSQDVRYSFISSFGSFENLTSYNPLFGLFYRLRAKGSGRKKQAVAKVEVSPGENLVIREGEKINFSAIARDAQGNVVQGVEFEWLGWNYRKAEPVKVKGGVFEGEEPGVYYVGARMRGAVGTKRIVVREDVEFRAMKELMADEVEEAEAKEGNGPAKQKKRKKVRQEVLDAKREMKAARKASIKTSSRMRKKDKGELKRWDKEQRKKRKAQRQKKRERRKARLKRLQNPTSDLNDKKTVENKTVKAENLGFLSSRDDQTIRENRGPNAGEEKSLRNAETSKARRFASGMLSGVNSSSQAYGAYIYPFPESGSGGGSCPPWQRSCGGGSTTYYSEMEVYVDGNRTTGDFIGLYPCNVQVCSNWTVDIPTDYQDGQSHTVRAYVVNDDGTGVVEASGSPKTFTIAQPPEWTNGNWETSDDPGIHVGSPPNQGTTGAGSGNFGFSAPVASLPGRNGLDVNLFSELQLAFVAQGFKQQHHV